MIGFGSIAKHQGFLSWEMKLGNLHFPYFYVLVMYALIIPCLKVE